MSLQYTPPADGLFISNAALDQHMREIGRAGPSQSAQGSPPSIDAIKALDGKNFAMLTPEEETTLNFYRNQGRKFDVSVAILSDADPKELERASRGQADEIMKRANSQVRIVIGPGASAALAARAKATVQS